MTLTRQQNYRVSGRVIDSTTGRPPAGVSISLGYRSFVGGTGSFSNNRSYDANTGNFELQNVPPGSYVVLAEAQQIYGPSVDAAAQMARNLAIAERATAQVPIRVTAADLAGVVVTMTPGISVSGRLLLRASRYPSFRTWNVFAFSFGLSRKDCQTRQALRRQHRGRSPQEYSA